MNAVVVRAPRSRALLWVTAMLWNAGGVVLSGAQPPLFALVGILAALFFGYFAARSLFGGGIARFGEGRFVVRVARLPPFAELEHPIADIDSFVAEPDDEHEREGHAVFLVTRGSSTRRRLVLPLAGAQVHARGGRRPLLGTVTLGKARDVAQRLNDALEDARRASSHYRAVDAVAVTRTPRSP